MLLFLRFGGVLAQRRAAVVVLRNIPAVGEGERAGRGRPASSCPRRDFFVAIPFLLLIVVGRNA